MTKQTRLLSFLLLFLLPLLLLLLCAGCSGEQAPEETEVPVEITAQQGNGAQTAVQTPAATLPTLSGDGLVAEQAVGYAFKDALYGGVIYRNTNDRAMVLTEASFTFTYAGGTKTEIFTPFSGQSDLVYPGETAFVTLFLPVDGLAAGGDVALHAALTGEYSDADYAPLLVADEQIIQNYPGFATLSGSLLNPGEDVCALNLVYVGFFDENNALLGVWYFTRNAVLQAKQSIPFVVHMQTLPIEGLAERTAYMQFKAFGM